MMCAIGPGLRVVVTDAAHAVLGTPVLPTLWAVLEARGTQRGPSEHDLHGHRLRVVADGTDGLVVGTLADFASEAAA